MYHLISQRSSINRWSFLSLVLAAIIFAISAYTVIGHTTNGSGNHLFWVKDLEGTWYSVNVKDYGLTREYKDGSVMLMDYHYNSVTVVNGACLYFYPFCFGAPNSPKITYSHPENNYTLTDFGYADCLGEYGDLKECWESFSLLGWLVWNVDAVAERTIPLADYPQYVWVPGGATKTSHSDTYQVN